MPPPPILHAHRGCLHAFKRHTSLTYTTPPRTFPHIHTLSGSAACTPPLRPASMQRPPHLHHNDQTHWNLNRTECSRRCCCLPETKWHGKQRRRITIPAPLSMLYTLHTHRGTQTHKHKHPLSGSGNVLVRPLAYLDRTALGQRLLVRTVRSCAHAASTTCQRATATSPAPQ